MRYSKDELFICSCHNVEHQLIFSYFPKEGYVYVNIHLVPDVWYKRIWYTIKYIFGYKCKYGCFDEFAFNCDDYPKLEQIVNYLKECAYIQNQKIQK